MPHVDVTRRGADLRSVIEALRTVHLRDGYPTVWPVHPEAWLTPGGTLGAWVAVHDGVVIGHVLLVTGENVEHIGEIEKATGVSRSAIGGVSRLFVTPQARGLGAASALLDEVESAATEAGLQLALDVIDDGGPAVSVYEHRGWRRVAVGPAGWTRPDGVRPQSLAYVRPR